MRYKFMKYLIAPALLLILLTPSCEEQRHDNPDPCGDGEISASDAVWSHGEGDLQNTKRARDIRIKGCLTGPLTSPTIKWSFTLGGPGTKSAPVIGEDGTVYIVGEYPGEPMGGDTRNSGLLAISSEGNMKWFFPVPQFVGNVLAAEYHESPAIAPDGTIYFGAWDSTLYALNPNGAIKWSRTGWHHKSIISGYPPVIAPAIDGNGQIYSGTDTIFCLKPDGSTVWKYYADTMGYCQKLILGRNLIFCAFEGKGILALDYSGKRKWIYSVNLDNQPHFSLITDQEDNLYFKVNNSTIYSVNSKGSFRWGGQVGGLGGFTEPVLRGDYLYIGSLFGYYRLDKQTGTDLQPIGTVTTQATYLAEESSPVVDDNGTLYFGTRASGLDSVPHILAYNAQNQLLWDKSVSGVIFGSIEGRLALGNDGTIYLTTFTEFKSDAVYKVVALKK